MNQSACSSKSTASFLFHKGVRKSYVSTAGQGRRQILTKEAAVSDDG